MSRIDNSDRSAWANSGPCEEFVEKIENQRDKLFRALLKDGEKHHSKNVEGYKAYEQVLRVIQDFKDLR